MGGESTSRFSVNGFQLTRLADLINLIIRSFNIRRLKIGVRRFFYYFRIWLMMSKNSFLVMLSQKKVLSLFLVGKLARFGFFTAFLYYLVVGADSLAGYGVEQSLFFFLTFNVIDILGQFLYREVYRFRPLVVSGDFDLVLIKPVNALFRVLMGGADVIDMITIPPLLFAVVYIGRSFNPTLVHTSYFILLIINGLLISTAFHIAVLSLGIITLEIDHTIMIYRDLTNMGRLPTDIYKQPLRGVLTFLVPVGIMITLPAKALMGFVTPLGVLLSLFVGVIFIFVSVEFWRFALKRYTSASS